MNVLRRRDFRGAFRAKPEDILRDAIARHRALQAREELRAKRATPAPAKAKKAAPRKTGEETRRAQFAEGLARAAFGRFYHKERSK
jgi:hypothetical protein